jgi:hypothetical protein
MSGSAGGRRKTGDTAVATEIELKLRFPPKHLREVLALPLLAPASRMATRKLAATYFDTPTLDLSRRHIALRVRREGRRWVQAVKGGGSTASGVHQRLEIETTLNDRHPDLSLLPRHPVTRILKSKKIVESLLPVLHTEITRSLRLLEPVPGVLVEVAIDRGVIRSGRRREPVCEIELELKSGPVTALVRSGATTRRGRAAGAGASLQGRTRLCACFAAPARVASAKAAPVMLTREMTAGQGFLAKLPAWHLAQVHANERGVHALRRIRNICTRCVWVFAACARPSVCFVMCWGKRCAVHAAGLAQRSPGRWGRRATGMCLSPKPCPWCVRHWLRMWLQRPSKRFAGGSSGPLAPRQKNQLKQILTINRCWR